MVLGARGRGRAAAHATCPFGPGLPARRKTARPRHRARRAGHRRPRREARGGRRRRRVRRSV